MYFTCTDGFRQNNDRVMSLTEPLGQCDDQLILIDIVVENLSINTFIFQCFDKKAKKTSPEEEGEVTVHHDKKNISRVGNAYISSDNVIVSESCLLAFTVNDSLVV